jgi:hypothetical protein
MEDASDRLSSFSKCDLTICENGHANRSEEVRVADHQKEVQTIQCPRLPSKDTSHQRRRHWQQRDNRTVTALVLARMPQQNCA